MNIFKIKKLDYIDYLKRKIAKLKKIKISMNIVFYFAFLIFGFGAAFALDKLLRAVKLI